MGNMDMEIYKKIKAQWTGNLQQVLIHTPGGIYNNFKSKVPWILPFLSEFRGLDVLDIGCNAGILTYEIAQHANSVCGVEEVEESWEQALITAKYIDIPCFFYNKTMKDFILEDIYQCNALFAASVLYHLSTEEIHLIRDRLFPNCKVVVFMSREDRIPTTKNPYKLWHYKNIEKLLDESGFDVSVINVGKNFTAVVGKK